MSSGGGLFVRWEYWKHLLADEELMLSDMLQCQWCCVLCVKGYVSNTRTRLVSGKEGKHNNAKTNLPTDEYTAPSHTEYIISYIISYS